MDKFKFSGAVSISHLNTRKEGEEDNKVLAADVKFKAIVGNNILNFFEPALIPALYLDGGAVRNEMMGPIQFLHKIEHYRLETFGSTFYGVSVGKFTLLPQDINQVELTFSISFKPSGDEIAKLAEYLQDMIDIRLEPENEELDLEGNKNGE